MELRLSRAPRRVLKSVTCTGALLLVTAAAPRAGAGTIVLTAGTLQTDGILAFRNIAVDLTGPAFNLNGGFISTFVTFLGTPHPAELPLAPGTEVEFDAFVTLFVGSGMVSALFSEATIEPRLLQLDVVRYDMAPVPEPSTLLLLAGGLTALVARARSRGSAG